MNDPYLNKELPVQDDKGPLLPWSLKDTWIGLGMFAVIQAVIVGVALKLKPSIIYGSYMVVILELIYILPVVIILAVRRADFKLLGYRGFKAGVMGIGCGLVVGTYLITIVNNAIFVMLGVKTQAEEMSRIMAAISSPAWLIIAGVIVAPVVEESLFRGFIFAGFRQRYGFQTAALLSSALFAIAHHQLAALIPTFVLGYIFSHLYQKSNSIFPGMILHFLVNAFGIITLFVLSRYGYLTPR
jgi:membrane protease YdiL (CAAX protease family)